ncbi:glutathione S-transferase [Snodgrassella communis]|jgi:glutathione S-transferase|uniref:Glutathione S-transferase n=1 Tax=Snodgrassella communis TaxID=2946699 RepID=A0A066TQ38_9NEIS|nr:glutathione binding-like protein [Snodgrassella communis]KDN13335.1 Glutathione S-transferase [Snodgrassella communis]KDN15637.1 Glutathione S-transferase [Snodgrassella communis]PIT11600.1 glutathione S-transferase [Snodgrassella communis]PIT26353.1 glutathione S-transferase [Snodgrassella communis]PIT28887.1 glutathione S-transferase [Snodgrassella communis]
MLKLYYIAGTCSFVPHVALQWSGLQYTAEEVGRDTIKSAQYLALNPQGQVPLLTDGNWALSQNIAIIDYINDLAPDKGIYGATAYNDPKARAKARQWLAFANSDLHSGFKPIFGAARMIEGEEAQNKLKTNACDAVAKMFAGIDQVVAQQDYLTGHSISIADVYVYIEMHWAQRCKIDLSQYHNLNAFYQRVEADDGVTAVLKAQRLI